MFRRQACLRAISHPYSEKQDVEKVRQLCSHLESILNVAQRLRLRCFHRLRPCWTNFLNILQERRALR